MAERAPAWRIGGVDIADPHFHATEAHHEVWRQARARHPIAWTTSQDYGGFWSITTYELGGQALRRSEELVSARGMRLGGNAASVEAAADRMLVVSDGPAHRRLRSALAQLTSNETLTRYLPDVERRLTTRLAQLIAEDRPIDIVGEFARTFPQWLLFGLMDVPEQDWDRLGRLTDSAFDDEATGAAALASRREANAELFMYVDELVRRRRSAPGDDVVTALAAPAPDGTVLSDDEAVLNCIGLLNGGLETVPHAASGTVLALARYPGEWRKLQRDNGLADRVVEEVLRWTSPAMHVMRTATHDLSLGAAQVRKGDRVVVWLPACNRDSTVFEDGDRFTIGRPPRPHLALGGGPHYCVGAKLARAELVYFLNALLDLVDSVELTGVPRWKRSNFLHGLDSLEVRLVPKRAG
jgi:cytochrome P450